jgi:hypothetical protein
MTNAGADTKTIIPSTHCATKPCEDIATLAKWREAPNPLRQTWKSSPENLTPCTSKRRCQKDRVELTGLHPLALPHHRTCGFPHPAVESSGFLFLRKLPRQNEAVPCQGCCFERLVDHYMPGHSPSSPSAACYPQRTAFHTQSAQRFPATLTVVPPEPETFTHVTSDPPRQSMYIPAQVGVLEISPPSCDVA